MAVGWIVQLGIELAVTGFVLEVSGRREWQMFDLDKIGWGGID